MKEWICAFLLIAGSVFMLIAALGVLRFPDVFTRMHAAAKAASFGVGLILAAVAVNFGTAGIMIEAMLVIVFIFLTAPVSSHMIGRAAYFLNVPMWQGTVRDELRDRYDLKKGVLSSQPKNLDTQKHGPRKIQPQ
ncbi:MAG: monovalent cation/H(+) antiporter subunit G [candidate division KSB1 bacterium]|nr:monovalent cation/H(+) antiporter subunit G [candidate division KSB1 bacterium]